MLPFQVPSFYEYIAKLASQRDANGLFQDSIKPFLDDTVEIDKPKEHFIGLDWQETLTKIYTKYPMLAPFQTEANPSPEELALSELYERKHVERKHVAEIMTPKKKREYKEGQNLVVVTKGKAGTRVRVYRI